MIPAVHTLARQSLRFIVIWLIGRRFLEYLLESVLNLGAMAVLVGWTLNGVGLGLAVWLLHHWEPHLRKRVLRLNTDNWLVGALGGDGGSSILRAPRAFAAAMLIGLAISWDVLHQLASRSRELRGAS